eukprot:497201_1
MDRRNARLRREYLYRKHLERGEAENYNKKRTIREALNEGKKFPTELRNEEESLRAEIDAEDEKTKELKTHIDDEYAWAGVKDPKILLTTSRDPSSRLTQFIKEMKLVFPNSQRINRGTAVIKEIVDTCRANDFTDLIMFHETRGEPDGMIVSHLPYGPTCYFNLANCVIRHDIQTEKLGTVSEAYPHLLFPNFSTKLVCASGIYSNTCFRSPNRTPDGLCLSQTKTIIFLFDIMSTRKSTTKKSI